MEVSQIDKQGTKMMVHVDLMLVKYKVVTSKYIIETKGSIAGKRRKKSCKK